MEHIIIDYKNKYLIIKVHKFYNYDISFDKLRKNEDWWFNHLSGKVWFKNILENEWNIKIKELKDNDYGRK